MLTLVVLGVVALASKSFAAQVVPLSLTGGPLVSCTIDKTITWPDIPIGCDSKVDQFDGGEYFPTIIFQLEKILKNGDRLVVDQSIIFSQCNTDGVDGTTNSVAFNAPDKLPALWNLQGGAENEGSKKFSLNAHFLTNNGVTFTPVDFTFNGACEFEAAPATKPPVCTSKCTGPTARCEDGECKCGDPQVTLSNGVCPPRPVPGTENQDCQLGDWYKIGTCSNACGPGKQIRHRFIVAQAKGTGEKCPEPNCDSTDLESEDICVQEEIDCDGSKENPDLDCNKLGSLGAKCRASAPKCDTTLECKLVGHRGIDQEEKCVSKPGAKGEYCAKFGTPVCEAGLTCQGPAPPTCKVPPTGCFGCACNGDACDSGLVCKDKLCAKPAAPACAPGDENCDCNNGACNLEGLTCQAGKCRTEVQPIKPCDADHCGAISDCATCRESAQKSGKACQWCTVAGGQGKCAASGPECQECPSGSTALSVAQGCPTTPDVAPESSSTVARLSALAALSVAALMF
mmetsp:Transcript_17825/g.31162  ORF Transcript_17825/g.31162 Transcript_17825/m.31162 type:complete len:513 (+) Transcript_17825:57-1595(+)